MRLTRRMGPNYRACARGRLLRLFVWSSCLAAVLTLRPFAAAEDAKLGFDQDNPRIQTSAPIFFDKVDTVRITPFGNVSDVGMRTASADPCEQQSTYSDADFEGPSEYSIVFGLAETEIVAASYTLAPEFFPIEITSVEMVFAQIGDQDMVTELELLILKGTPNQGQLVATIPHTLNFPACNDGIFCNGTETCSDGSCVSGLAPCSGEFCNESLSACVECLDVAHCNDGQFCDVATGACVECLDAADCDDGDDCTIDTCNASGACVFTIDVGASCDDGEVCTVNDTCDAVGQCGGNPNTGASCNDGEVCTVNDTCNAVGQCDGDPDVGAPCNDGDGCTGNDACDAGGQCVGEPCDDGLFCNGQESCVDGVCTGATPPCVAESCDELLDECECAADIDCNDGNPCTDDLCVGLVCQFPNNSLGCNDLDPCTTGDVCAGGTCSGTPNNCNDGDACTQDTCNPADGQCSHDAVQCSAGQLCEPGTGDCVDCLDDADCDDGLFCNGIESCNSGTCLADTVLPCPGQLCDENGSPHCFDSDQGCDAINIVIDLSGNPVLVENNNTDTFSVGFRIVEHNNQTQNPCSVNPPSNSNAFPAVDVNGVQNEADNWLLFLNCGPLGCPAGWNRFEDLAFCEPEGDWVLRTTWTSVGCDLQGACCFEDGDCLDGQFASACEQQLGDFQGPDTTCDPNLCPPPIEACCFAKYEGCIDLDPAFCINVAGVPAGQDTTCDNYTCFPTGACCKPNGFCVDDVSMNTCEVDMQGTYQDDDTTCDNTTCPDPEGACCFSDEFCIVLTETQCEQGGATWHGPLTDCSDAPDDGDEWPDECQNDPIGACCLPDFTCADNQTSAECAAADGAFQGTGSECVDIGDECVAPTGACCLPAGQCLSGVSSLECANAGGTYQDDGSNCTSCSTQACCFEGAGCLDFPFATCVAAGGLAQGAGTTCAITQCPLAEGACCFETGLCLELTLADCSQGGGSWLGGDSVCAPDLCEGAVLGACCLSDNQCVDNLTLAECSAQPGEFQGDGSICANVECDVSQELEACCAGTDACIDLTPDDCINGVGGTPQGPGSTCANTECAAALGGCCAGDGSCSVVTEADCGADSYLGDDTDCTAGVCCQGDSDCDDGNFCNGTETCQANVCEDGPPPADDTPCDDGEACTDSDVCTAGICGGTTVDCTGAGDQCNTASCDAAGAEGNCDILTQEPNDTACNDGEACTESDTCTAGVCGGTTVDCTGASDQCNSASCDPGGAEGNCDILTPMKDNTPCDDEDGCTDNDVCTNGICGGTAADCGACCFNNGNCQDDLTENGCLAIKGTWQSAGTICTPNPCPACVANDGAAENDCCADAVPISAGTTNFNTTNANTDGPIHLGDCQFDGQTYNDIWFEYVADCSADTIVTTCEDLGGGSNYDTDLVVYDGCDCENLVLLGCNDDDPDVPCSQNGQFQSTVVVPLVTGNCYLVRIGGWFETDEGTGTLLIDPLCGACCDGDACSENQGPADCEAGGGVFQGAHSACVDSGGDVDCTITGACCTAGGNCDVLTPQACTAQSGGYEGDGTICDGETCGCGDCPTDADGNGSTGAFDLAILLGNWGPVVPATECLDADFNKDIGAFDLAFLLGHWGPCP